MNFEKNKSKIANRIGNHGIPDMIKAMVKRKMISSDEGLKVIRFEMSQRVEKLLDIIQSKKCFKHFIGILSECGLNDCAEMIKGKF